MSTDQVKEIRKLMIDCKYLLSLEDEEHDIRLKLKLHFYGVRATRRIVQRMLTILKSHP